MNAANVMEMDFQQIVLEIMIVKIWIFVVYVVLQMNVYPNLLPSDLVTMIRLLHQEI